MDRAILAMPGRAPIRHAGFDVHVNDSPFAHPWHRCCHGHYSILAQRYDSALILEDDVMLSPDFEERLERARWIDSDTRPFVVHLYAGVRYAVFPVERYPFELPAEVQDWGTQAVYYSAGARRIAADLCSAYLSSFINRPGEIQGVRHGFDCYLFPALRLLGVRVYYHAAVQHMQFPSSCLSPVHWSPYFPPPEKFPLEGWW